MNDSLWLLGRQNEGYVAVRRSCIGEIDSVRACSTHGGQTWVIIVGDSSMYGNFANFQNVVHQSQHEERWYLDTLTSQYVYYAKIKVDTVTMDYAWGVDSVTTSITNLEKDNSNWSIYPNLTHTKLYVDLKQTNETAMIQICNIDGEVVYTHSGNEQSLYISTQSFGNGIYVLKVTTAKSVSSKKFL